MTKSFRAVILGLSALCIVGCDDGPSSSTDGKTSWLHACGTTPECVGGLVCVCGVCTKPCDGLAECSLLGPNAICGAGDELSGLCGTNRPSGGLCIEAQDGQGHGSPDASDSGSRDGGRRVLDSGFDVAAQDVSSPDASNSASDGAAPGRDSSANDGSVSIPDARPGGDGGPTVPGDGGTPNDGGTDADATISCSADDDQDGVCNDVDRCPGGDDREDADQDGRPDACEPVLLMDVNTADYSSSPSYFTDIGGSAYFMTSDQQVATIWRTEPPWTAVSHVVDVPKEDQNDRIDFVSMKAWGDRLIVRAKESSWLSPVPDRPARQWTFDPGSKEFVLLPDEVPFGRSVKAVGDVLYVLQEQPPYDNVLWRTDGTVAGTLTLDQNMDYYSAVVDVGSALVYFASPPNIGLRLYRTDGTIDGTFPLTDPGYYVISEGYPVAFNGLAYFIQGSDWQLGTDIRVWSSDGSVAGTHAVFPELPSDQRPLKLAVAGDRLLVQAYFPTTPGQPETLWATPIGGGTLAELDVPPDVFTMAASKDAVYVSGSGKVYRNDGSSLSFDLIADYPGDALQDSLIFETTASGIYVTPDLKKLQRLDANGLTQVTNFEIALPSVNPARLGFGLAIGDVVLFGHETLAHGVEPWATDGTTAGTHEIANLGTTPAGSAPANFSGGSTPGSDVAFTATTSSTAGPIVSRWKTRSAAPGAEQGFRQIQDDILWLALDDFDFFWRFQYQGGTALLQVNRSTELGAVTSTSNLEPYSRPRIIGSNVVFRMLSQWMSAPVTHLTSSTPSLTAAVPFVPTDGEIQGQLGEPLDWGGTTWFVADGRLFRTDGTSAGTERATTLKVTDPLVIAGARLYFGADDGSNLNEIYRLDAPSAVPVQVTNFGTSGDYLEGMIPGSLKGRVVFKCFVTGHRMCTTAKGGFEVIADFGGDVSTTVVGDHMLIMDDSQNLWSTDGTSPGTKQLLSNAIYSNRKFVFYKGVAYFAAEARALGVELWRSDGTAAGTYLEADLEPGAGSSFPDEMYAAADGLYFRANTTSHGAEPWVMRY